MIPIPKPKFFERKVPAGQSEDDYFDEITARQTHILRDAVDRVSLVILLWLVTKYVGDRFNTLDQISNINYSATNNFNESPS